MRLTMTWLKRFVLILAIGTASYVIYLWMIDDNRTARKPKFAKKQGPIVITDEMRMMTGSSESTETISSPSKQKSVEQSETECAADTMTSESIIVKYESSSEADTVVT
ncbi:hypothetical protein DICVIV_02875 [Dictyocaulus viviparus]|uniref:Uncharacterized protein n=1 Tax=Dictyocaulus viviparus TaxID=29172 RepID=A0A0D8Y4I5_DICVI|nr:hypothetical protein DICVIV_02875 [Dictyocaulus viviparus]